MKMLATILISVFVSLGIVYYVLKRQGLINKKCKCKKKPKETVNTAFNEQIIDNNNDGIVTIGELLDNLGIDINN